MTSTQPTTTQPTSMRPGWLANFGLALLLCSLVFKLYWDLPQDPRAQLGYLFLGATTLTLAGIALLRPPARSRDTRWWVCGVCIASMVYVLGYRVEANNTFMRTIFWGNIAFRLLAQVVLLSLGTSYAMLPALREVRRGFIYRVVRHPVYALYMLADLTLVSLQPSLWNIGIAFLGATTFFLRSTLEEKVLAQDAAYATYRESVPWRFFPGVY